MKWKRCFVMLKRDVQFILMGTFPIVWFLSIHTSRTQQKKNYSQRKKEIKVHWSIWRIWEHYYRIANWSAVYGTACGWYEQCTVILHIEIQYHKILPIVCRLEHWTTHVPCMIIETVLFSIYIYDKCESNVDCDRSHKCSFKVIIKLIIDVVVPQVAPAI